MELCFFWSVRRGGAGESGTFELSRGTTETSNAELANGACDRFPGSCTSPARADLMPNDHTYPSGCLRLPRLPSDLTIFGLVRCAHAHTPTRSTGFCAIWMSISSDLSSRPFKSAKCKSSSGAALAPWLKPAPYPRRVAASASPPRFSGGSHRAACVGVRGKVQPPVLVKNQ